MRENIGYFENRRFVVSCVSDEFQLVWPAYQTHLMNALAVAREDSRITFLDASRDEDAEKQVAEAEHVARVRRRIAGSVTCAKREMDWDLFSLRFP